MTENLIKLLAGEKICPIIRNKTPEVTLDIAKALVQGGIKVMEIVADSPAMFETIEKISEFSTVCAGGIITSMQAEAAIASGAKILSSPVFSMNLVKLSKDKEIPFIAGTSTANEAYTAWKARIPLIKIYPITAMGGSMYVENILRPMPFLNIMPSGNVKLDEVKDYISAGARVVGIGRDFYEGYSFDEITKRTEKIIDELGN